MWQNRRTDKAHFSAARMAMRGYSLGLGPFTPHAPPMHSLSPLRNDAIPTSAIFGTPCVGRGLQKEDSP